MRILHTSDWHLGKRLYKLDRTPEHHLFLQWLVKKLKTDEIDLLLIAGDIFDVPTPPHQSLQMFYDFLHQVSVETKTQTFIIAGNHDSGVLLKAPANLLLTHRVKVWGELSPNPQEHWHTVTVGGESLDICGIPFFRSYELLSQGEDDPIRALKKYLHHPSPRPQLLMLHHLAGVFEAAGSEQVISLSGVDSIPAELLEGFHYVALGHIHKPQKISSKAYYSGSPLPMRFSETHPKSLMQLEVNRGEVSVIKIPLPIWRPLHVIKAHEGSWREKIQALNQAPNPPSGAGGELTAVVEVQLSLTRPLMGILDEIKSLLQEKQMELLSYLPTYSGFEKQERKHPRLFELSILEVFHEFYRFKYPDAPEVPEDLEEDFKSLIERANRAPE
jgi:DNA repair protein SbcD/Mre11